MQPSPEDGQPGVGVTLDNGHAHKPADELTARRVTRSASGQATWTMIVSRVWKTRAIRDLTTAEVNEANVSRHEDQEEDGAPYNVCNRVISIPLILISFICHVDTKGPKTIKIILFIFLCLS